MPNGRFRETRRLCGAALARVAHHARRCRRILPLVCAELRHGHAVRPLRRLSPLPDALRRPIHDHPVRSPVLVPRPRPYLLGHAWRDRSRVQGLSWAEGRPGDCRAVGDLASRCQGLQAHGRRSQPRPIARWPSGHRQVIPCTGHRNRGRRPVRVHIGRIVPCNVHGHGRPDRVAALPQGAKSCQEARRVHPLH